MGQKTVLYKQEQHSGYQNTGIYIYILPANVKYLNCTNIIYEITRRLLIAAEFR
jgi:hypothetical protein